MRHGKAKGQVTANHGLGRANRSARRGFFHLMYVTTMVLSTMGAKPARAHVDHKTSHTATAPALLISTEGWGTTPMADLRLVLEAVAAEIAPRFPQRRLGTLRVVHGDGGPMAFYEKSAEGDYVIRLSAQHSRWHQFVYQFAHELCHVYSNFDNKAAVHGEVERSNQWFEESVCEAAALYTVKSLARRWETEPPAPQFAGYAATLKALADYLVNEPHRNLPPSRSLASWFKANHSSLEDSPYLRDKNEVVANQMLPLFEETPDALGVIGYLNLRPEDANRDFADYLQAWYEACPEAQRDVVQRIIALFEEKRPEGDTKSVLVAAATPSTLLAARTAE